METPALIPRPERTLTADRRDARGLRALLPFPFGHGKTHLVADLEVIEAVVQHAVAVEIDLLAVRRGDEAVAFVRKELGHMAVGRRFVDLDLAATTANVILQLALGRVEGIPNRDVHVLVGALGAGIAVDHDLATARHRDVDVNAVMDALLVAPVRRVDHDAATRDALRKAL